VASQLQRTKEFEQGNFTFWMAGIPSIIVSIYFIMIYVHSKSNVILLCVVAYILLAIWSYVTGEKKRKSKRSAWDEYIRQIEEMSELDEENDKAESETKN
jgi:peptidoglycan/LPS O-acetylase OafA/YrhL